MKSIFLIFNLSILFSELNGQEVKQKTIQDSITFICSFKCENSFSNLKKSCLNSYVREKPVESSNVNPYAEFDLIISMLSRDRNNPYPLLYTFKECDVVCNAASLTVDSIQYIYYNQTFINNLKSTDKKLKWIVRSIIAHEIGHHILDHTVPRIGRIPAAERRRNELRADYFSAFVIRQFPGATIEDAYAGLQSLDAKLYTPRSEAEENNSDYPTLEHRMEAIREGFTDDKDSSLRIAMFRNIDSIALISYTHYGKSIILREVDKAISFNNLKEATQFLEKLKKEQNLNSEQKKLIIKVQNKIDELDKSIDDSSFEKKPTNVTDDDIKELERLYNKYKDGTPEDKKKAEAILKQIKEFKSKIDH